MDEVEDEENIINHKEQPKNAPVTGNGSSGATTSFYNLSTKLTSIGVMLTAVLTMCI